MEIDEKLPAIVLEPAEAYEILVSEQPTSLRTSLETELKAAFIGLHTKPFVALALRAQFHAATEASTKKSLREAGMDLMSERFTVQSLRRILACCIAADGMPQSRLHVPLSPRLAPSLLRFYQSRAAETPKPNLTNSGLDQLLWQYIAPPESYREKIAQLEGLLARLALAQEATALDDNAAAKANVAVVEDR